MKKTFILFVSFLLLFAVACDEKQVGQPPVNPPVTPPEEPPANSFTVTFLDENEALISEVKYLEGEMLHAHAPELPTSSISGNLYYWNLSILEKITDDITVNRVLGPRSEIIFYDISGNPVYFYSSSSEELEMPESEFPEVPEKEGYEGYWNLEWSSISAPLGIRETVKPCYFSLERFNENTTLPKSIIKSDGVEFWITEAPVASVSNTGVISYVSQENSSYSGTKAQSGKIKVSYNDVYEICSRYGESGSPFYTADTKGRTDLLVQMTTKPSFIGTIVNLRENRNSTWSVPTVSETGYIIKALLLYSSDQFDYLLSGRNDLYLFTTEKFYRVSTHYEFYALKAKLDGKTSTIGATAGDDSYKCYFWPVCFEDPHLED